MFSLLVGAPAWRHVDLLPIVAHGAARRIGRADDPDDDDSDLPDASDSEFGEGVTHLAEAEAEALFEGLRP